MRLFPENQKTGACVLWSSLKALHPAGDTDRVCCLYSGLPQCRSGSQSWGRGKGEDPLSTPCPVCILRTGGDGLAGPLLSQCWARPRPQQHSLRAVHTWMGPARRHWDLGVSSQPSVQFSSVTQSCPILCNPMNRSMPGDGLPVHHQLPESTQTHARRVGYAIQPSHPLSSPSPPAPNPSQHQGLFQWVNSLHEVAKVLEFQLQHQSFQWILRTDLL